MISFTLLLYILLFLIYIYNIRVEVGATYCMCVCAGPLCVAISGLAPSVQHLMWGVGGGLGGVAGVLLSISKIDGKERQPGSVAAAQGGSGVVCQKTTLKTICTRIPSVSKSSGERVPSDRKTY